MKGKALFVTGKHVKVYREIVELCARFGYVSIREVMYACELSLGVAIDRLTYLDRCGLLRRFPSGTMPQHFYCLTPVGREAVEQFQVADEIREFQPARDYKLIYQHHHRLLIKSYVALKAILGQSFLGWVSEAQLKQEYVGSGARVMDGEFFLAKNGTRLKCGLELELTMKAPARYRAQFEKLSSQVYDRSTKRQEVHILLFLFSSQAIAERLCQWASPLYNEWGQCSLYFCEAEEFFQKLCEAQAIKMMFGKRENVRAREIGV